MPQIPETTRARIAIIGGSGTYRLPRATIKATFDVETPYGPPSSTVTLAEVAGRTVAFLPRHGGSHSLPPQKINYRANMWALKSLGVQAVMSSSAVGGLREGYGPETFVVTDQLIDRTWGRADTFFDGTVIEGMAPRRSTAPARLRAVLPHIALTPDQRAGRPLGEVCTAGNCGGGQRPPLLDESGIGLVCGRRCRHHQHDPIP